jgi:hypothetical protein
MAAGLGFKDFVTGEVLTAADVDGYLMQGIWVFASAAARDAAVTSPQEGNACYLKDTNQVLTYSGSAWVAVGGGSPLTTKGDLYTFSTVDARLGVGANGTTLVADSAEATGLKWAAPASGGTTLLQSLALSGASVTSSTFSSAYTQIMIYVKAAYTDSSAVDLYMRVNADTASNYGYRYIMGDAGGVSSAGSTASSFYQFGVGGSSTTERLKSNGIITITRPSDTDVVNLASEFKGYDGSAFRNYQTVGVYDNSAAITSVTLYSNGANWSGGTAEIYGVK